MPFVGGGSNGNTGGEGGSEQKNQGPPAEHASEHASEHVPEHSDEHVDENPIEGGHPVEGGPPIGTLSGSLVSALLDLLIATGPGGPGGPSVSLQWWLLIDNEPVDTRMNIRVYEEDSKEEQVNDAYSKITQIMVSRSAMGLEVPSQMDFKFGLRWPDTDQIIFYKTGSTEETVLDILYEGERLVPADAGDDGAEAVAAT